VLERGPLMQVQVRGPLVLVQVRDDIAHG